MAHEIENMMFVGETPWHKLGVNVVDAPNTEDAIKLAGLDWGVSRKSMITCDGVQVPDAYAIERDTDKSILGVVGKNYHPLQNKEAFEFFDSFVKTNEATLETAGSLRGGKRVWVLARINRNPLEIVKNDFVKKYVLLSNSHDGTMSVRVGFTPIRVVCANTLAMSHGHEGSKLVRVFHSKSVKESVQKLAEVMNLANANFEATAEQYRILAKKRISKTDLEKYVEKVFFPQHKTEITERVKLHQQKTQEEIFKLFESGRGTDIKGVKGTYWGAYNAVTEFLSYQKGKDFDSRLDSLWFGASKDIREDSLDLAFKMAV
jgi:phage/plasmid-like protein (TIGR03299 family)